MMGLIFTLISSGYAVAQGEWVDGSPQNIKNVGLSTIEASITNNNVLMKVTLYTGDSNCERIDWGQATKNGNRFIADSKLKVIKSDPANPFACTAIVQINDHTYELGKLDAGNYNFIFKILGQEISSKEFTIQSTAKDNDSLSNLVSTGVPVIYIWGGAVLGAIIVIGIAFFIKRKLS